MTIETQDDVVALKRIGKIVSFVLQEMLDAAEPGMATRELDSIGEKLLERHGARSAPKLTYDFPGSTCISINEEGAHCMKRLNTSPGISIRRTRACWKRAW